MRLSLFQRFLYFGLAFLILYIEQLPAIYLGTKSTNLIIFLILIMLLISEATLFLGKHLGLLKGFRLLNSKKAWGAICLTCLGILLVAKIGTIVMIEEGITNTANQKVLESIHMNPIILITRSVIMAPIVEELVFRGLLMTRVFNSNSIVGLIVSSFLFGLVHIPNSVGAWIIYGGMGVALATVYRTTKKLEYSIMAHMINNTLAVSMMLFL